MARLPTVGGDSGNWGTVLNEYLGTAHNADGTLKLDVQTLADLKAIDVATLTDKQQALVAGYSAPGDGGGGTFYYDAAASAADNGGTIIAPTAGAGRWIRSEGGVLSVEAFGSLATFVAYAATLVACRAYLPAGEYAWPDGVEWPSGLVIAGDPAAWAPGVAPTEGTRITSTGRIAQGIGGGVITGAQDVAFLGGFRVRSSRVAFERCYFGGDSALIDATGSTEPHHALFSGSMMVPGAGKTALSVIGGAHGGSIIGCRLFVQPRGRGLHMTDTGFTSTPSRGWDIGGTIAYADQTADPALPIGSLIYIEGAADAACDFAIENRRATAYTDGAPVVFGANAVNCDVKYSVSDVLFSVSKGNNKYNSCERKRAIARVINGGDIALSNRTPPSVTLLGTITALRLPPVMQRPGVRLVLSGYTVGSPFLLYAASYAMTVSSIANAGTGYTAGDVLIVSGGTPVDYQSAAILVGTVDGGGAITAATICQTGWYTTYTGFPANPVSVTGGTGSGAQFNLTNRTDIFNSQTTVRQFTAGQHLELVASESQSTPFWITDEVNSYGEEGFSAGDTTPSVIGKRKNFKTADTGNITITGFDDSIRGQTWLVTIVNTGTTTIDCTGTNLVSSDGSDIVLASGDVIRCTNLNGTKISIEKLT